MKIFLLIAALLLLPAAVRSQFLWNISHTDFDGRYYYRFDAISCEGSFCTSAGSLVDNATQHIYKAFWRSIDNGRNWSVQDAGMPYDSNLRISSYFTAIQQIDPFNAIAGGVDEKIDTLLGYEDSSLILRTYDGGKSWKRQNVYLGGIVRDIYFLDSAVGILNVEENFYFQGTEGIGDGRQRIFTTSDGGSHWDSVAVKIVGWQGIKIPVYCSDSHSFKIFSPPQGPIFSTTDNWKTISTSNVLIDSASDPQYLYRFFGCNFTHGDTIIAYGSHQHDTLQFYPRNLNACLIRSIDGGKTWEKPQIFADSIWELDYMTPLDRDTVLAGGKSGNKILMSTDHGATWKVDSLPISDTNFSAFTCEGLAFPSGGYPLGIFSIQSNGISIPSIIIRAQYAKSRVNFSGVLNYNQRIYPNPATTFLNIVSVEASTPYKIIDVLGRTVLSGMVADHNTSTLDISGLPRGVYYVLVERADIKGVFVIAGKFAAIEK